MEQGLVELIVKEFPVDGGTILVVYFVGNAVKALLTCLNNSYSDYKSQNEDQLHSIQKEYKEFGHTEAERNAYKANSEILKEEYYKQQAKINALDKQVESLTIAVEKNAEEREQSGQRLDRMIAVYEDLSTSYKEMNTSLQATVKELGASLEICTKSSVMLTEKMTKIEGEITVIKNDVKEIKAKQ